MDARTILKRKGRAVVTISPEATLREAMAALLRHKVGAIVVQNGQKSVVGIVTERDILRLTYEYEGRIMDLPVSAVMTRNLLVAKPGDPVNRLKTMITENRIRHLPVMDDGELVGILSIGDLMKQELLDCAEGNEQSRSLVEDRKSA